jgi:ribosomal protein S18 acetylase RimI-like enzyme
MVSKIREKDEESFNKLGSLIDKDFIKYNDFSNIMDVDSSIDSFGYYNNDVLIGFIEFSKSFESVDIIDIVVEPTYRRKGIATKLLNHLIDNNRDVDSIFLEVRDDNKDAIEFYLVNNFEVINKRKAYYKDGVDALIMKRDVANERH